MISTNVTCASDTTNVSKAHYMATMINPTSTGPALSNLHTSKGNLMEWMNHNGTSHIVQPSSTVPTVQEQPDVQHHLHYFPQDNSVITSCGHGLTMNQTLPHEHVNVSDIMPSSNRMEMTNIEAEDNNSTIKPKKKRKPRRPTWKYKETFHAIKEGTERNLSVKRWCKGKKNIRTRKNDAWKEVACKYRYN